MSVEKIPNVAAHGASNAKNGGNIKSGHGAPGGPDTSDSEGAFGALLSSLGVDDVEPAVASSAVPITPDDQRKGDPGCDGSAFIAFAPIVQAVPLALTAASVADVVVGGTQNALLPAGETPSADGVGLMAADTRSSSVLPGVKQGVGSPGQLDLSQMPGTTGAGTVGSKTVRFLKERARTESASTTTTVPMPSANQIDTSKSDMRLANERADFRVQALPPAVLEALPLEIGQQAEFRRDKAIFKVNSTTAGADANTTNGLDSRPASFSLESLTSDVGAGMAQGEQNPGTYWMSSDLTNAEMRLDGFGESVVEVSVSVHGNQTHVAFRTDDTQTRLAMEDANVALKDMLSKEGLDLAGVSVGTSGAGGDGAQDNRSRQDGRPARIGNLAGKFPAGASGHVVTSRVGQLDVFV